jgi:hypothetical protein
MVHDRSGEIEAWIDRQIGKFFATIYSCFAFILGHAPDIAEHVLRYLSWLLAISVLHGLLQTHPQYTALSPLVYFLGVIWFAGFAVVTFRAITVTFDSAMDYLYGGGETLARAVIQAFVALLATFALIGILFPLGIILVTATSSTIAAIVLEAN